MAKFIIISVFSPWTLHGKFGLFLFLSLKLIFASYSLQYAMEIEFTDWSGNVISKILIYIEKRLKSNKIPR